MTFRITKCSIMTISIMTISLMTFSIMAFIVMIYQHKDISLMTISITTNIITKFSIATISIMYPGVLTIKTLRTCNVQIFYYCKRVRIGAYLSMQHLKGVLLG